MSTTTGRDVADALDVVVLGANVGLDVREIVGLLAVHGPRDVAAVARSSLAMIDAGRPVAEALLGTGLDPQDPLALLFANMARAHVEGLPLADHLEVIAADLRRVARRREQAAARRLAVRLTFPLVLCVFPAFVLLTVAPVVIDAMSLL